MESTTEQRSTREGRSRLFWIIAAALVLSVLLFGALQLIDDLRGDADDPSDPPPPSSAAMIGVRPASFRQISEFMDEGERRLRLSGEGEPGAALILTNRGERLRQLRVNDLGQWGVTLEIDPGPMAVEAQTFARENTPGVRTEETVFRLPVPAVEEVATANYLAPALIMVTSPGRPTRVIQSPFGPPPTVGPVSISVIDYDYTGGVIITGTSSVPGRIRIYAQNTQIGETGIGVGGRWNYIAGRILPRGALTIRAELIPAVGAIGAPETPASLTVPFTVLPPLPEGEGDSSGALQVDFQPLQWQVRRTLIGGGGQSTVIFAPDAAR